jgi:hypothetical protein
MTNSPVPGCAAGGRSPAPGEPAESKAVPNRMLGELASLTVVAAREVRNHLVAKRGQR